MICLHPPALSRPRALWRSTQPKSSRGTCSRPCGPRDVPPPRPAPWGTPRPGLAPPPPRFLPQTLRGRRRLQHRGERQAGPAAGSARGVRPRSEGCARWAVRHEGGETCRARGVSRLTSAGPKPVPKSLLNPHRNGFRNGTLNCSLTLHRFFHLELLY